MDTKIEIQQSVKDAIALHADEFPDKEVCGLVLHDGTVIRSTNTVDDSGLTTEESKPLTQENGFMINESDWIRYYSLVAAIYHSHWSDEQPETFSPADIHFCKFAAGKPYILYHTLYKSWDYYDPKGLFPYPLHQKIFDPQDLEFYKGWVFDAPRSDCLEVFRSYYKGMLGIQIPDFPRPSDPRKTLVAGWNDFLLNMEPSGFKKVAKDAIAKNDVLLMTFRGINPHHIAIYLGDDRILHLCQSDRLSTVEPYIPRTEYWDCTHSAWRYDR